MPYANIVFIKLYLDLFDEDDRFLYGLNDRQQLLYVKLLYLSGKTYNKISKNFKFIQSKINYQGSEQTFRQDIGRIKDVFKRFTETKHYYRFRNFEKLHNRVDDYKKGSNEGTPNGTPKGALKESKIKENKRKEIKEYLLNIKTVNTKTPTPIKDLLFKIPCEHWHVVREELESMQPKAGIGQTIFENAQLMAIKETSKIIGGKF